MSDPDQMRLVLAATAFLEVARREFIARNPAAPCFLPTFETMDLGSRRAFLKCVSSALRASEPKNVQAVMQRMEDAKRG